ncbi:hypothetical protein XthCFBP4691_20855, partial [Xanthomonas theicola]
QFGYVKVRYRGLAKNTAQVLTLFALSNPWMKPKQLMPVVGRVCLSPGQYPENAPETAKTKGLSAVSVADLDCLIL